MMEIFVVSPTVRFSAVSSKYGDISTNILEKEKEKERGKKSLEKIPAGIKKYAEK
jgi:hypothetical protein